MGDSWRDYWSITAGEVYMRLLRIVAVPLVLTINFPAWSKDIVVIGGGLAGLTGAYEIQKTIDAGEMGARTRIRLFEAKDRVGGRVFTVRLNGKPAELGAESIGDGGDALQLRRVARELGLQIDSRKQQSPDRYFYEVESRTRVKINELKPFFPKLEKKELVAALKKSEANGRNLSEVLDHFFAMFPPVHATEMEMIKKRALIRRIIEEDMHSYEGGTTIDLSSRYAHGSLIDVASAFLRQSRRPEPEDSIAGGNSKLALALAEKLKGKVFLSSPLTAVARSNDGGYNLTVGGQVIHADILILAIPCKPYGNIQFAKDTIPAERIAQIAKVGYGTHAKILIPITGGPLKELPTTAGVTVWQRPDDSWLTAYFTGPAGVMRDPSALRAGADLVGTAFSAPAPFKSLSKITVPTQPFSEYESPVAMSWAIDPYTGGSYSYYTPQLRDLLETTVTAKGEPVVTLFAPIDGRLFFAGEHTTVDQDIRGTMEAAVDSGVRAARLIKKVFSEK